MYLKLNKLLRIRRNYLPSTAGSNLIALCLSLVTHRSSAGMNWVLMAVQHLSVMQKGAISGTTGEGSEHGNIHQSYKTSLQWLDSVQVVVHSLGPSVQADSMALLSVIFGYVMCQPVHFGFPALSEGFVKLESEVF